MPRQRLNDHAAPGEEARLFGAEQRAAAAAATAASTVGALVSRCEAHQHHIQLVFIVQAPVSFGLSGRNRERAMRSVSKVPPLAAAAAAKLAVPAYPTWRSCRSAER